MRFVVGLLGGALAVALVGAAVEVLHPHGVSGFLGRTNGAAGGAKGTPDATGALPAAPSAAPGDPPSVVAWGPGAAQELGWADRAWDRGDFDGAVSNFLAARALASGPVERDRATRGLERAVLAWGLVLGSPKVPGAPSEAERQWSAKAAAAEASPSERAWTDAARFAAGAGLAEHLPYAAGQALDTARPGGFVQAALEDALASAGGRRDELRRAMAARGLAPADAAPPVPSATAARPPAGSPPRTGSSATKSAKPEEESGIGGVNSRGIPFGAFSAATRTRLRAAVEAQRKGALAYEQAAPDSPNRAENRSTALHLLQEARDAYLAAQQEDASSRDLDERLTEVMRMIAQLKKDGGIAGR